RFDSKRSRRLNQRSCNESRRIRPWASVEVGDVVEDRAAPLVPYRGVETTWQYHQPSDSRDAYAPHHRGAHVLRPEDPYTCALGAESLDIGGDEELADSTGLQRRWFEASSETVAIPLQERLAQESAAGIDE